MRFRFEILLRLNSNRENLLQRERGDILSHQQRQQNRQDLMQNTKKNSANEINQRMKKDLKIDTYILYDNFFHGVELQKGRQQKIISEIGERVEAKRKELVEARRKRRTMEILKERDLKLYAKKREKIEVALMDENASSQ
ncbi:MAG: flagellar FliJ family protein [Nitrospinae bacterium]|nr:flagellar FliJ family protein [Nitrospinota bacterium]